jgi:hypothetical protein
MVSMRGPGEHENKGIPGTQIYLPAEFDLAA